MGNTFSKVEEKKDEHGERVYLLWIPDGTVKVVISSDSKNFAPVEYFFTPRVKKAETYLMELKLSLAKTMANKQYLEFHIDPSTAYLEINNEPWEVKNGVAYKQLPKGIYQYRAQAKDFHSEVGTIDFSDLSAKKIVQISLKPNFGWLTITPPKVLSGITVFIDDEIIPSEFNRIKLTSGQHTIKVTCEKYLPYNQTIEITDGQEVNITPMLTANFSTVSITTKGGASIYIDDKLVGTNNWEGPLSVGSYLIGIKKDNHKTISETIYIPHIGETYAFNYKDLTPILGSVSIETNPPGATIYVDNKEVGKTPIFIPEIIIGQHSISASLTDHKSYYGTFIIEEGKQINLSFQLDKGADELNSTSPKNIPIHNNSQQNLKKDSSPVKPGNNNGEKLYAIMDANNIIKSMPEYLNLQRQIAQRQRKAENTIFELQRNIDRAMDTYKKNRNSRNADAVAAASNELNTFKDKAQKDLEQFQKDEMSKLQKKLFEASRIVGEENRFEIIFPSDLPAYCGSDVIDATELVKRKLNNK